MKKSLLDLPNELLEMILFHTIDQPWKDDVCNFFSFTSTCRHLRRFVRDERYWKIMARRRDPTCENLPENTNWFEYCKQIYRQRTIPGDQLKQSISRFDENYFCTIEKVSLWPNQIRVYIDERGDYSLGSIQNPVISMLAFADDQFSTYDRTRGMKNSDSQFSIANPKSQYLGYLDFSHRMSLDNVEKNLTFQYGYSGYNNAILFQIDRTFIDKYNLTPLLSNSPQEVSLT